MRLLLSLLALLLLACPPVRQGGTPPSGDDDDSQADDDDSWADDDDVWTDDDDDDPFDDDDDEPVDPGFLIVEPSEVDFGVVRVGEAVATSLRLINKGSSEIFLLEAFIEGDEAFGVDSPGKLVLFPGEGAEITVFFEPSEVGFQEAALVLFTEGFFQPKLWIPLFGEGV